MRAATGNPPRKMPSGSGGMVFGTVLLLGLIGGALWWWYGWRIEPENGQIAILIRKTGQDLAGGQILAEKPGQKGIQLEVLPEGRYFRNPYTWAWELRKITDIPAGRLGVQVRLYGREPEPGRILAGEGEKGILREVLRPGKHRVNPYACEVREFEAITVRPGSVGVVTSLVGEDVLSGAAGTSAEDKELDLLVGPERKGVLGTVLDPGTYYLNPYICTVVEVSLQSQRFEMGGNETPSFLSLDGFTVEVEGTIEFNVMREEAARITHRVGDIDDIVAKIILPRARGFIRIEGSKKAAVDFIAGQTRQEFQNSLEKHLKKTCDPWGISINSVLIRNIVPPEDVAKLVRDREIAVQEARKYEQQILQARSKAELTKQKALAEQNTKKVVAETEKITAVIGANRDATVKTTLATQELEVAKIDKGAAEAKALAVTTEAKAKGEVIRMKNEAEAKVLADKVKAFGNGQELARFTLYSHLAPRIRSLVTNDSAEGVGGLFGPGVKAAGKEVAP